MYENSVKSSSNELLEKPSLHDPLYKLFLEQLFGDFATHNKTLFLNCN